MEMNFASYLERRQDADGEVRDYLRSADAQSLALTSWAQIMHRLLEVGADDASIQTTRRLWGEYVRAKKRATEQP